MRQLILLRHAKAAAESITGEDFDRALAERGREDAPAMGAAMAAAGAAPLLVLVSSARRTRETWGLVAPYLGKPEVRFVERLYLASSDILLQEIDAAGVERVMVVAHNPGLHELAARLAHRNTPLEAKVRAKFPTSACAIFSRKDDASSWRLEDFLTPKLISD